MREPIDILSQEEIDVLLGYTPEETTYYPDDRTKDNSYFIPLNFREEEYVYDPISNIKVRKAVWYGSSYALLDQF